MTAKPFLTDDNELLPRLSLIDAATGLTVTTYTTPTATYRSTATMVGVSPASGVYGAGPSHPGSSPPGHRLRGLVRPSALHTRRYAFMAMTSNVPN